jgi:imidazolonepropionase-like amidohydrolase
VKLIVKCGWLFDGTDSAPSRDRAVVLDGDRIAEVISLDDAKRPDLAGLEMIDASTRWVMPGLINVHDHLIFRDTIGLPSLNSGAIPPKLAIHAVRNALTALRRGWTTVRDMGASHGIALAFRDILATGEIPGPRVISCGSPISITGGHAARLCDLGDGPLEVRKAARRQILAGADFIKVMASHDPVEIDSPEKTVPQMSLDEIQAAFDVARDNGKLTACHVMGTIAIGRVLDAGVNVMSHGYYLNDELAQRMAEQKVFLDPTLSSYGRQTMNPKLQRGAEWAKRHETLLAPMENGFRAAVKAGVKIVAGTDSAGRYAEDVAMMREFGLDPMKSLLACTLYAAQALDISSQVGTVEKGKIADLVVIDGNPLNDAYDLEKVDLVIQGGKVMRPADITINSLV